MFWFIMKCYGVRTENGSHRQSVKKLFTDVEIKIPNSLQQLLPKENKNERYDPSLKAIKQCILWKLNPDSERHLPSAEQYCCSPDSLLFLIFFYSSLSAEKKCDYF